MNLYGRVFSDVYNLYWTEFIDIVTPQLIALYKSLPISEKNLKILDLCCGTGRLSKLILESGNFEITGIDQSEAMINLARKKLKDEIETDQANFIVADVVKYHPDKSYGMVVSTFDSLNQMNNYDELNKVFENAFEALLPGGIFIFDLNTKKGLKDWEFIDLEEEDDLVMIFHGEYDRKQKQAFSKVYGFHKKGDNCWEKFEEVMSNNVFSLSKVEDLLHEVGFEDVFFTEDVDLSNVLEDPESKDRVFVVAKKL